MLCSSPLSLEAEISDMVRQLQHCRWRGNCSGAITDSEPYLILKL
jgi:hypothetical protein